MKVYLLKDFARFSRKEQITEQELAAAIARAERSLVDATLGGGLIKQRVARKGAGRSGGYRTIIAYRQGQLAVFLHGFAKNSKGNLTSDELLALRRLAEMTLRLSKTQIAVALADGRWKEIAHDAKEIQE